MKYESETGESMEKPGKKLKKLLIITGTTGAVYAGFKYLLPLVAPFFVGYILALLLRPSARFLSYRMRITVKGKRYHMPIGVIGGVEFLAVLSVLGTVLYRGALKLCAEGKLLMVQLPVWLEQFDLWLTGNCHRVEHAMGLRPGCVADMAGDMLYHMVDTCKTAAMPFLMANSMSVISCLAKAAIVSLVVFLAAILSLQEMEDLRDRLPQGIQYDRKPPGTDRKGLVQKPGNHSFYYYRAVYRGNVPDSQSLLYHGRYWYRYTGCTPYIWNRHGADTLGCPSAGCRGLETGTGTHSHLSGVLFCASDSGGSDDGRTGGAVSP